MKKILFILFSALLFINQSFASLINLDKNNNLYENINENKLQSLFNSLQEKWLVTDICFEDSYPFNDCKQTSSAYLMLAINFKKHKLEDFLKTSKYKWILQILDFRICKLKLIKYFKMKKYQEWLESYLKCVDNVAQDKIDHYNLLFKNVWLSWNYTNLLNIANKYPEYLQKKEIKNKKLQEEISKKIKLILTKIFEIFSSIILMFWIIALMIYLMRVYSFNKQIKNLLEIVNKNIILLESINYLKEDQITIKNKLNKLKEKLLEIKSNFNEKNEEILSGLSIEIDDISREVLNLIDKDSKVPEKVNEINNKIEEIKKLF